MIQKKQKKEKTTEAGSYIEFSGEKKIQVTLNNLPNCVNACHAVTPNSGLSQVVAGTIPLKNLMNVLLSPQLVSSAVQKILWIHGSPKTRGKSSTAAHDGHSYQ